MVTKLGFKRLLAAILVAAAAAAGPARGGDWMPLLPDQDFYDFQLFAPPHLNEYSIRKKPREGIFFSYDRLYWGITNPQFAGVANTQTGASIIPVQPVSPQTVIQLNNEGQNIIGGVLVFGSDVLSLDLNNSWLRTKMTWGNRYEGGWIYGSRGVGLSYFDSGKQAQSQTTINEFAVNSPQQIFEQSVAVPEGLIGGFPIVTTTILSVSTPPDHLISQNFTQRNETRIQSGAAVGIIRRQLDSRDSLSTVNMSLGPRFLQFEDRWNMGYTSLQFPFDTQPGGDLNIIDNGFQGGNTLLVGTHQTLTGAVGRGTVLQQGAWETYTSNNMVGPEFGLLLETERGRWTLGLDLRFTAGFNWQNNIYRGSNFPESVGADYIRSTFEAGTVLTQQGDNPPVGLDPPPLFVQIYGAGQTNATNAVRHQFVFSPLGEWRLRGKFQVSQAIALEAGYTGMWLSGIARASSNTGYETVGRPVQIAAQNQTDAPITAPDGSTVPPDGWYIDTKNVNYNRIAPRSGGNEYVFVNGIDFGITVNY